MELTGKNFIGSDRSGLGDLTFQAVDPSNGEKILPMFFEATLSEVDTAIQKAEKAFQEYRVKSGRDRARFLKQIGIEIMELGDPLIRRCCQETGLPEARIAGERGRTVNQLNMFADLLLDGWWVNARIDTADPERQPVPRPDVRSRHIPLGPVGIFGASNFPLAFSVAGGDTASALAAGCTIVVKAHPAHPGTCEMIGNAIERAIHKTDMPVGTFSMVHGHSVEVGMHIVKHPFIKAVGFTGSFKGGKAIYDAAVRRPIPIPVFAEMGSVNPVFILPGAMAEYKESIAEGLAASVTLGVGQFCTNPGLVAFEGSSDAVIFQEAAASRFKKIDTGTMLTSGIHQAYRKGIENITGQQGVKVLAEGIKKETVTGGTATFLQVDSKNFLSNRQLEEEIFGPSTLAINASDKSDLLEVAHKLKGHLTATLYATEEDLKNYPELVSILERKIGRLIINGFPTGVEVCHAMIHGGAFPATTDSRSTSVGTYAIYRFSRPVSYQNFPDHLLPDELKNDNPLKIWRLYNGEWKK
ncbi:MAG: aldehyde dehydrogenase (NADP(+)) [Cyclobacteriaceae bacterium]|nr:aldehyde dehydrogenase (NADP(+)) [Cyclobacteriaceae bacterium]